ncbi:MAG: hypothetical protein JW741_31010 [Sedimentisphaerales bacterium]|nr:hypothetical protein [Sedimentisphaerales bacterium]
MARRKKKIGIKERILSWRGGKSKRRTGPGWNWVAIAKVTAVVCLLAATGVFLRFAEGYVTSETAAKEGSLILVDVPRWVNWDLKARVMAMAGGAHFPLREETAEVVARNLDPMAWLDDIGVLLTHDAVRVKARWRKPVALIDRGSSRFYVDAELVVLDHMPMAHLPIVEVKGLAMGLTPSPGQVFDRDDLAAAVALIILLQTMDTKITPDSPLLEHIASIDVSNYKGRKRPRESHIVLYTKDGTQIIWGAEIGDWATYLEAKDEQKLAKIYTYYEEYGSLSAGAKYINLRDPQDKVPQPIDKYRY